MRISYGANNTYKDVTEIVSLKCHVRDGHVIIPAGDENRASLFGDPLYGVVKNISIEFNGQIYNYSHTQEVSIPRQAFQNEISPRRPFKKYPNNILVESGTYQGDGIQDALDAGFKNVISYEIAPQLFLQANNRFRNNPNVLIYMKPSQTMFDEIKDINEPITFWLDGHYSTGNSATTFYQVYCPLLLELDQIAKHHIKTHTILIDDVRYFGHPDFNYITKQEVIDKLLAINPNYQIRYENGVIENDVMVAYSNQ